MVENMVAKMTELRTKYETTPKNSAAVEALKNLLAKEKDRVESNKYDPKMQGDSPYSHVLAGNYGYLSVNVEAADTKNSITAFVLEDHEAVSGAGVKYRIDFGVLDEKTGAIYRDGWYTVRSGTDREPDNFAHWYNEIKVLEEKDGAVTFGVKSGALLEIYSVNLKDGSATHLEQHDLAAEANEKAKAELEKKVQQTNDFEAKLKLIADKLAIDIELIQNKEVHVFPREGGNLGIIVITAERHGYDRVEGRKYRAVGPFYFYAIKEGQKEPKELEVFFPFELGYPYTPFKSPCARVTLEDKGDCVVAKIKYSGDYSPRQVELKLPDGLKQAQTHKTMLLVVDDEKAFTKSWEYLFKKDIEVLTAKSLDGAKKALEQHGKEIGAILTDMNFPEKDGGEVCSDGNLVGKPLGEELIRYAKENYPDIKVVANSSEVKFVRLALDAGADESFQKPADVLGVKKAVMEAFEKSG